MRSWEFNYTTLDGISGVSYETLPDYTDPPVELRRPITSGGKKIPLISILNGEVPMAGTHRLYERRSFTSASRSAHYVEVDPAAYRPIANSEAFKKNSGNGGPSRGKILKRER
jgi:hypothetical protein